MQPIDIKKILSKLLLTLIIPALKFKMMKRWCMSKKLHNCLFICLLFIYKLLFLLQLLAVLLLASMHISLREVVCLDDDLVLWFTKSTPHAGIHAWSFDLPLIG